MNKIVRTVIEKMIHLPHDFKLVNKSELTLLEESGYFQCHDQISGNEIRQVLKSYPHLIENWLQFSADCRSSEHWFFTKGEDGDCYVGHWPEGKEFGEVITSDELYAWGVFIKREAEATRILFDK